MPRPRPACGTYNGWHAHKRRGEEPDEACWEAKRAFARELNAKPTEANNRDKRRWARVAAINLLIAAHHDEYEGYLKQERAKLDEGRCIYCGDTGVMFPSNEPGRLRCAEHGLEELGLQDEESKERQAAHNVGLRLVEG